MVNQPEDNSEKIKETAQKANEILKSLEDSGFASEPSKQGKPPSEEKKQFISGPWIAALAALATVILTIGIQIGVRIAQDLAKQSRTESKEDVQVDADTTESPQPPKINPSSNPTRPESTAKPKEQLSELSAQPSNCGEWGCTNDYKFGRIPDREYPNSCAFSQTDPRGTRIISRSSVEFWACRDDGGDASSGYKVSWSDGKSTTYTFGPGGQGLIVGTDGRNYPISWRNGSHNGNSVIIINHEDGAETWIPGSVNL
jgi:hypothetical protein